MDDKVLENEIEAPVIDNELEESKDLVEEMEQADENVEESSDENTESDTDDSNENEESDEDDKDELEDVEESDEEIEPINYDTMPYNDLKSLATEKGLQFTNNIKKVDLIAMLKASDTELPPVNNDEDNTSIPVVTLDNKPVSPIVVEKDDEVIPHGFVQVPTKKDENKHGIYNGRIFKVLTNGRGMYADSGETFDLSTIK